MSNSGSQDLEDLLDQVEKKYFSPAAKTLASTKAKDCECNKLKPATNWDEVDDLLKDFKFEDNNPFAKSKNISWVRQQSPSKAGVETNNSLKCFPVYLSGSYKTMGLSEVGKERPCDKLKCISCDFKIVFFDNFEWDASTDYLFLRNNIPDFEKLAMKLTKRRGTRAYGCQCQHISVNAITNIASLSHLKWVCGRHPQ